MYAYVFDVNKKLSKTITGMIEIEIATFCFQLLLVGQIAIEWILTDERHLSLLFMTELFAYTATDGRLKRLKWKPKLKAGFFTLQYFLTNRNKTPRSHLSRRRATAHTDYKRFATRMSLRNARHGRTVAVTRRLVRCTFARPEMPFAPVLADGSGKYHIFWIFWKPSSLQIPRQTYQHSWIYIFFKRIAQWLRNVTLLSGNVCIFKGQWGR